MRGLSSAVAASSARPSLDHPTRSGVTLKFRLRNQTTRTQSRSVEIIRTHLTNRILTFVITIHKSQPQGHAAAGPGRRRHWHSPSFLFSKVIYIV